MARYEPIDLPFASATKRATHDGRVYECPAPDVQVTKEDLADPDLIQRLADQGKTIFYPSVTTIGGTTKYNKRLEDYKMQQAAEKGIEQSRYELMMTSEQGTRVHDAIEQWNMGNDLSWFRTYIDKETGEEKQMPYYDDFEWMRICRYMQWYHEVQPKFLSLETIVYSHKFKYAGQMDALAEIEGKIYVCDWKTSKQIDPDYLKQASAYFNAWYELTGQMPDGCLVLALNVQTKQGWRATYVDKDTTRINFRKFRNRLTVFYDENPDFEPSRDLLPLSFNH